VRLIITESDQIVADIPDYQGPVPRAGEYIHHPREEQPEPGLSPDHVMSVKLVSYGIIARPADEDVKHFVGAAEPFVEVVV
jgi:hypothetical protein